MLEAILAQRGCSIVHSWLNLYGPIEMTKISSVPQMALFSSIQTNAAVFVLQGYRGCHLNRQDTGLLKACRSNSAE